MHRGTRGRRHRRRDPERGAPRPGRGEPHRRRRHERGDRARRPRPAARRIQPTGPAFEGAQIDLPARGAGGDRARPHRRRPWSLGSARSATISWSDEPGFDATTVTGVAGSGIIEAIAELFLAGVVTTDGAIDGSLADRTPRGGRRSDVLLRAARCAGSPASRDHAERRAADPAREGRPVRGVSTPDGRVRHRDRRSIRLAGAFGAHIDPVRDGARSRARLRPRARHERRERRRHRRPHRAAEPAPAEIEAVVRRVEKLETAVEPRFQEHFVGAMGIPRHRSVPRLGAFIDLPPRRIRRRAAPAADAPANPRSST